MWDCRVTYGFWSLYWALNWRFCANILSTDVFPCHVRMLVFRVDKDVLGWNGSRSRSMRSRTSFWLPEGRMHVPWRSRGERMCSSSRSAAPTTFTHSVCLTQRRLTNWSKPFLLVSAHVHFYLTGFVCLTFLLALVVFYSILLHLGVIPYRAYSGMSHHCRTSLVICPDGPVECTS